MRGCKLMLSLLDTRHMCYSPRYCLQRSIAESIYPRKAPHSMVAQGPELNLSWDGEQQDEWPTMSSPRHLLSEADGHTGLPLLFGKSIHASVQASGRARQSATVSCQPDSVLHSTKVLQACRL